MRKVVIRIISCCAALLPLSQAGGATRFGEFFAGQTFTMKVTSASEIGKRPSTLPKFKKGQFVKFRIGPQGQLTGQAVTKPGPTFSINYKSVTRLGGYNEHYFTNKTTATTTFVHEAVVQTKGLTNFTPRLHFINLTLRQQAGFTPYQASYTFQ